MSKQEVVWQGRFRTAHVIPPANHVPFLAQTANVDLVICILPYNAQADTTRLFGRRWAPQTPQ